MAGGSFMGSGKGQQEQPNKANLFWAVIGSPNQETRTLPQLHEQLYDLWSSQNCDFSEGMFHWKHTEYEFSLDYGQRFGLFTWSRYAEVGQAVLVFHLEIVQATDALPPPHQRCPRANSQHL